MHKMLCITPIQLCVAEPDENRLCLGNNAVGELMGIEVLDHLVVGPDRFISMKEAGYPRMLSGFRLECRRPHSHPNQDGYKSE